MRSEARRSTGSTSSTERATRHKWPGRGSSSIRLTPGGQSGPIRRPGRRSPRWAYRRAGRRLRCRRSAPTWRSRSLARLGRLPAVDQGGSMSDWVRVATFEGDENSARAIVDQINSEPGPPPGIPAKSIMVGLDRDNNHVRIVVRFDSKENLDTGSATLDGMEPPP